MELRSINVDLLQRKIEDLEQDNKTLHAEAFNLAQDAYKCEEKEEKLVKDAVQHLTQANYQIKDLHSQFTHKVSNHGSCTCCFCSCTFCSSCFCS